LRRSGAASRGTKPAAGAGHGVSRGRVRRDLAAPPPATPRPRVSGTAARRHQPPHVPDHHAHRPSWPRSVPVWSTVAEQPDAPTLVHAGRGSQTKPLPIGNLAAARHAAPAASGATSAAAKLGEVEHVPGGLVVLEQPRCNIRYHRPGTRPAGGRSARHTSTSSTKSSPSAQSCSPSVGQRVAKGRSCTLATPITKWRRPDRKTESQG